MSKIANFLAVIFILTAATIASSRGHSASVSDVTTPVETSVALETIDVEQKTVETIAATPYIPVKKAVCDRIILGGNSICLFSTSSLKAETGNRAAIYGGNFYFGHNLSHVFTPLYNVSSFQIVRNGVTTNYKIVKKDIYCDYSNKATHPCTNWPNDTVLDMKKVLNPVGVTGNPTTISLMTCAGTPIGGGDATHRLVAYAVAQ